MIGQPDEGHIDCHIGRNSFSKEMLLQTIGFSNLTLCTIAIYCMMKMALRDTEKYLYLRALSSIG